MAAFSFLSNRISNCLTRRYRVIARGNMQHARRHMLVKSVAARRLWTTVTAAIFVSNLAIVAAAAQSILVTEAENGTTITLARGDALIVSLQSNPSTGFSWHIAKNDIAMLKLSAPSDFHMDVFWMPGTPGHESFKFDAISSGTETLELDYSHTQDKSGAHAKTFSVVVIIK